MYMCEAFQNQPLFLEYESNLWIALTNTERLEMAAEMVIPYPLRAGCCNICTTNEETTNTYFGIDCRIPQWFEAGRKI